MSSARVWLVRFLLFTLLSLSVSHLQVAIADQQQITIERLDKTIHDVISKREYQWRLPRQKSDRIPQGGMLAQFFETLLNWLKDFSRWLQNIWTNLKEWVKKFMPKPNPSFGPSRPATIQQPMLLILIALAAAVLLFFVVKLIRNRRRTKPLPIQAEPVLAQPDLTDDNLLADSLPETRWQSLANDLLRKGEFRLALRALYMAVLAFLGERELIRIAKYKSNQEYERELERRTRERQSVIQAFSENVSLFERAWYGSHPVTEEIIEVFAINHDRIKEISEKEAV